MIAALATQSMVPSDSHASELVSWSDVFHILYHLATMNWAIQSLKVVMLRADL